MAALAMLLSMTACREGSVDDPIKPTVQSMDAETKNITYLSEKLPVSMDSSQADVFAFGNYIFWEEGDFSSYYEILDIAANAALESPFPKYEGLTKRFQPVTLTVQGDVLDVIYSESEFDEDGDWLSSRIVQVQLDESLTPTAETVLCEYGTGDAGKTYTPYVKNADGSYF